MRGLHVDTHGSKHNGKLAVLLRVLEHVLPVVLGTLDQACLAANLGSNVVVGQTWGAGKKGQAGRGSSACANSGEIRLPAILSFVEL